MDSQEIKEDEESEGLKIFRMDSLINHGSSLKTSLPDPDTESVFTLCYTSGTTGYPKGVMLSHKNVLSTGAALQKLKITITEKDTHISYLPLAHVFERVVLIVIIARGGSVGFFGGDVMKLKEDLEALQPTIFISVPRLFIRFYDGMKAKI